MGQCCPVPGTYWGSWNTTLQTKRDDCALHCRRKKYRIIVPQIWKNHLIKSITLVWNFKVNQLWPKEGSPLSIWHSLSMKSSRLTSYFMVKPGIRQGRLSLSLLSVYLNGSLSQGIREEKVILLSWKTWDLAYLQMTRCWSWRIMKKSSKSPLALTNEFSNVLDTRSTYNIRFISVPWRTSNKSTHKRRG